MPEPSFATAAFGVVLFLAIGCSGDTPNSEVGRDISFSAPPVPTGPTHNEDVDDAGRFIVAATEHGYIAIDPTQPAPGFGKCAFALTECIRAHAAGRTQAVDDCVRWASRLRSAIDPGCPGRCYETYGASRRAFKSAVESMSAMLSDHECVGVR